MFRIMLLIGWEQIFEELSISIKRIIEENGHKCVIQNTIESNDGDVSIVVCALRFNEIHKIKGYKILFQIEELWNRREKGHYDVGNGFDKVFEMYKENTEIKRGTANVIYCPIGYTKEFHSENPLKEIDKDIDLFFYGSMTPRRKNILHKLSLDFSNLKLCFRDNIWEKERNNLINRSKIVLNIKANELWSYGPLHVLPAQSRTFVLSEECDGGYDPYNRKRHMEEFNLDNMYEKIEYWLNNTEERVKRQKEIYENVKNETSFDETFLNCLKMTGKI